jgi:hypothetical protein
MELVTLSTEKGEEVLAADMTTEEFDDLREWFCYTKPLGRSMNVVARPTPEEESVFHVRATGTVPGPSDEDALIASVLRNRA